MSLVCWPFYWRICDSGSNPVKNLKPANKYLFWVAGIIVTLLISRGCTPDSGKLTIAIMGDQTGSENLDSSYTIMACAAEQMKNHDPDLLIHVGDLTESRELDNEKYEQGFNTAARIMSSVGVPWYLVAGDHDVNPLVFKPGSNDRSSERRFQALCAQIGLPVEEKLYYSVDFRGYHLVFLYSLENLHTDPRWGPIFLNQLSDQQLSWLRNDLEQNRNCKGILVVIHQPQWYSWSNWLRVHEVLRDYPVRAVIAGHYHYDQSDGEIDGIKYLVVGSTGGMVKAMDSASGGCYEYGLLTLSDGKIAGLELREVFSDSVVEWTSRRSMDRIQVIATSLSNVYNDERFYINSSRILAFDPDGNNKSKLDIESIYNPIDLPIEVAIKPINRYLSNPHWLKKDHNYKDEELTLQPGERCGWANYSNSGQWFVPDPLWEADIPASVLSTGENPLIGIDIQASFFDTRCRWVKSRIIFPLEKSK